MLQRQKELGVDGIAGTSAMHTNAAPQGGRGRGGQGGRGRGAPGGRWSAAAPHPPQRLTLLQRLHAKDTRHDGLTTR